MTTHAAASDDAERAGRHAARATVADVSLNVDVLELIVTDGTRRARDREDSATPGFANRSPTPTPARVSATCPGSRRRAIGLPGNQSGPGCAEHRAQERGDGRGTQRLASTWACGALRDA